MREHPPVLRVPNKRTVFEVACPPGAVHEGMCDYAPTPRVERAVEWHVNFADTRLFTAYGTGLFAQDEMQVAEHPALGALREALNARRWPTLTEECGQATPVLVRGVQRRCRVQTDANAAEGRPYGLYGNRFMMATGDGAH